MVFPFLPLFFFCLKKKREKKHLAPPSKLEERSEKTRNPPPQPPPPPFLTPPPPPPPPPNKTPDAWEGNVAAARSCARHRLIPTDGNEGEPIRRLRDEEGETAPRRYRPTTVILFYFLWGGGSGGINWGRGDFFYCYCSCQSSAAWPRGETAALDGDVESLVSVNYSSAVFGSAMISARCPPHSSTFSPAVFSVVS